MKIESIQPTTAYKYLITSWNEGRKVAWVYKPYPPGSIIDGPANGTPPGTWEIICEKPDMFVEKIYRLPVPHTDEVRICFKCNGAGRITCGRCGGKG